MRCQARLWKALRCGRLGKAIARGMRESMG